MAIVFDGTTNLLSWAGAIRSAFPITMFCWAKRVNTGSDQNVIYSGASTSVFAKLQTVSSSLSAYGVYGQSAGFSASVAQASNTEFGWSPMMVVVTATNVKTYYGVLNTTPGSTTHSYSDTLSTHTSFTVGGNGATPTFKGEISDVAVWNTALGDTEWATLKAGTAPEGVASGSLVEAWALRELGDYTGVNGRTLALTGTVTRSGTDPFVRTAPGATATTLTGPSSGTVSVASTSFTVGANGTITGTVTVTPADGGAGGTFTPTSVAISSGTPTGTFTYTPASTGIKTISISDDGGLTDATSLSYTSNAAGGTFAPRILLPRSGMGINIFGGR